MDEGNRMIPVDNESELMDRLFDFLAPTMEQEDLYLIRSPVCLTLDVSIKHPPQHSIYASQWRPPLRELIMALHRAV